jgi:hypothetical protein|tara:strand:- start:8512 stop:9693 length:1182 start_codon:yes stop_codon:yes gene_type:complete
MIQFLKRNSFPAIIALSALSVSGSAAFYSVYGLSKLFAGAQLQVIIMAGSLEVAKLVIASLLYQYWNTINKILRVYLTVATIVLVLITSMGIYGFLSSAYQETYQKLVINENKIEFLENKAQFYENDVNRFDKELEQIMDNISTLSNAKSRSIQVKDTSVVGGVRNTISTVDLRLAQNRLNIEENNRKDIYLKRTVAADSLQKYKLEILELENNQETVGELGPLQYLSGLTGTPMDRIINILLLVIIFVFDPLAISLVVAANFAFDIANRKNLYNEYEDEVNKDLYDDDEPTELQKTLLMDVEVDAEEVEVKKNSEVQENDWKLEEEPIVEPSPEPEIEEEPEEIDPELASSEKMATMKTVKKVIQKGPSKARVQYTDGTVGWENKDDVIRYL